MEAGDSLVKAGNVPTASNFRDVPLIALRQKGRLLLSRALNSLKIFPSEEGYPRDWRGIAYLAGLQSLHESGIVSSADPMAKVLQMWSKDENLKSATFANLDKFLGAIDRWDVVDDIKGLLAEDAELYLTTKQKDQLQPVETTISRDNSENNILTKDDLKGSSPQLYDAFVLFADEDIDFATELIERMENFGFKLCVRERDLIGGSLEHNAILRLISERCNRLIVIVSPSFLKSPANTFFVIFAQTIGIEQGLRKIVPCLYGLYDKCALPANLRVYFSLNYHKSGRLWDFWEKLKDSIKNSPADKQSQVTVPSITITEYDTSQTIAKPCENNEMVLSSKSQEKRKEHRHSITFQDYPTVINSNFVKVSDNSQTLDMAKTQVTPPQARMRGSYSVTNLNNMPPTCSNSVCDISNSSITLTGAAKSSQTTKKKKWYKKFLNPNSVKFLSSDNEGKQQTKKKWFRKKVPINS